MTHVGGDRFALRLRLPDGMTKKYVLFEVRFRYGYDHLLGALRLGQAISYRFVRDGNGRRVFASTKTLDSATVSDTGRGVIGGGLNVDHVAYPETDQQGNLAAFEPIALCTYGLSQRHASTLTGEAIKVIIGHGVRAGKSRRVERLDFATKKAQLGYASPGKQRMLSSFAFRRFAVLLAVRAGDEGTGVIETSPPYGSKIGRQKYARRFGISVHIAAAFMLARRGQRFHDAYVSSDRRHPRPAREGCARHAAVTAKRQKRSPGKRSRTSSK